MFLPLLEPARYKGAWGGRGSGKSHFFAGLIAERAYAEPGLRVLCVREVQRSLKESAMRLILDKIAEHELPGFGERIDHIKTPHGGSIIFQGLQDHSSESIKSFEGVDVCWIEEAQTLSERSLEMLRPTIRKPGSEIWASWNPRNARDPIDQLLRGLTPPDDAIVVRANYADNPWFPDELEDEREHDRKNRPDRYAHIWLGEYEPMAAGAIWTRQVLHENRRADPPPIRRIVVAVDHAVSSEPGSNEHGIVVCGLGDDNRGYVLEDATTAGMPAKWASRVWQMVDKWEADAVVIEENQGGDLVENVLRTGRPTPPAQIIRVRATRGKHVRAEPISALYGDNRISHIGTFPELEEQMCLMTNAGFEGDGSPDRVDALVWAFTELFPSIVERAASNILPAFRRRAVV